MALGNRWTGHDDRVADAEGARGAHVVEVAGAQGTRRARRPPAYIHEKSSMRPSNHQKLGCTMLARMINR